ncbi:glycosyltransferase family 4 protein [Gramella lutea]|uniref:Glycosyltransferase family 4 protein n=1 Tax=Christiangramia lutea TaxID=1607951 RepID=A0A9X1V4Q6_9FLAO|nr:glycosyltransferase family 4 protein [Christiangramia lutea]MCH4822764.1 glycosyltransferase family 4 protein [Christiangramia lutea]
MKVILSHPTGNAFVRAAAKGFLDEDMLYNFNTAVASFPGSLIDKMGGIRPFSEIRRRRFDARLRPFTNLWPWKEVGRLTAMRMGLNSLVKHENGLFCVDAVYKYQDRNTARLIDRKGEKVNAVYAYEDGAVASFEAAKKQGLECIYDLPIGYWRAARDLLGEERRLTPEWASTIKGFADSEMKLARKDKEISMADRIIVASKFTADTLKYYPDSLPPVKVIPYAFPKVGKPKRYRKLLKNEALKLLFVGGLSQRKGIAYLFKAVEALGEKVELTLVGQKPVSNCKALNTAVNSYRWIPTLSHEKVLKVMREHDILVFPSLFEGFGLVITEAMSQGTPVITTQRTAGPDLINNDENGWIVEAGSDKALISKIEEIYQNPEIIERVGKAAMETARQRTWETYGKELAKAVSENHEHINA